MNNNASDINGNTPYPTKNLSEVSDKILENNPWETFLAVHSSSNPWETDAKNINMQAHEYGVHTYGTPMSPEIWDAIVESKLSKSQGKQFEKMFGVSLEHLKPAFEAELPLKYSNKTVPSPSVPPSTFQNTEEKPKLHSVHGKHKPEEIDNNMPTSGNLRRSVEERRAMKAPKTSSTTTTTSKKKSKKRKSSKRSTTTTTTTTTTFTLPDGTHRVTTHHDSSHTSTSNDDDTSTDKKKKSSKKPRRAHNDAASRKKKRERNMQSLKRVFAVIEDLEDQQEFEEGNISNGDYDDDEGQAGDEYYEENEKEDSEIEMLEEKMTEMKKLNEVIAKEETNISSLRATRNDMAQDFVQLNDEQRGAKEQYEDIKSRLKELQTAFDVASQNLLDLSNRIQNKKCGMKKVDDQIEQRNKLLNSIRSSKRELIQQNKDLGRDIIDKLMSPLIGRLKNEAKISPVEVSHEPDPFGDYSSSEEEHEKSEDSEDSSCSDSEYSASEDSFYEESDEDDSEEVHIQEKEIDVFEMERILKANDNEKIRSYIAQIPEEAEKPVMSGVMNGNSICVNCGNFDTAFWDGKDTKGFICPDCKCAWCGKNRGKCECKCLVCRRDGKESTCTHDDEFWTKSALEIPVREYVKRGVEPGKKIKNWTRMVNGDNMDESLSDKYYRMRVTPIDSKNYHKREGVLNEYKRSLRRYIIHVFSVKRLTKFIFNIYVFSSYVNEHKKSNPVCKPIRCIICDCRFVYNNDERPPGSRSTTGNGRSHNCCTGCKNLFSKTYQKTFNWCNEAAVLYQQKKEQERNVANNCYI